MENYIRLFQGVCSEKNLSLKEINSSTVGSGYVTERLKALIAQGWTVPKITYGLGENGKQVYRWLEVAKCKEVIQHKIKALLA